MDENIKLRVSRIVLHKKIHEYIKSVNKSNGKQKKEEHSNVRESHHDNISRS